MDFQKTAKENAANIRQMKANVPHVFPQYIRLYHAQRALVKAQEELDEAQRAWDALGSH